MPPSTGVYATFAGAGTPVSLDHIHDAIWSKSWTPSAAQSVSFFLSANWFAPGNGDNSQVGLTSPNTTGTVTSGNAPIATRLVNAASFAENEPLPPGALVTISGSDLASDTVVADKLPFNSTLAGASIKLGGVALPILYASSMQINAQLPYDLPSDAQLLVQRGDASGSPIPFIVGRAQPGIFTTNSQGKGQGAVVFATDPYTYVGPSSLPFPARPAKKGDYLTIYCTGLGAVGLDQSTHTAVPPGAASLGPAPTIDTATASIGGIDAPVSYSGLSPGNPGLYQVNVQVPAGVTAGDAVRLTITISGLTSPPVTIAVQ